MGGRWSGGDPGELFAVLGGNSHPPLVMIVNFVRHTGRIDTPPDKKKLPRQKTTTAAPSDFYVPAKKK